MSNLTSHCLLLSDFNVQNLANRLLAGDEPTATTVDVGAYGNVVPTLIDATDTAWSTVPDCLVVWTRPQSVVPAFADVLAFKPYAMDALLAEVDAYAALLAQAAPRARMVLVPTWTAPAAQRGWGVLDMRPGTGMQAALAAMNLRLAQALAGLANVFVLDAQRWMQAGGKQAEAAKLWFMAKVPYGNEVFAEAARDVRAALSALRGEARKLVVVDLDDTLWGGIVGDAGWENLVLGGHDHAGEAYVEFQRALKVLANRGIVLGIVSKNTESVALEAISRHGEMQLRLDDFAGWRINWHDKAQNIIDLAAELRLGLQSVVFIDDNPVERERVRSALPEVLVPEWPRDPMLYAQALRSLDCFDVAQATSEDSARAAMYQVEKQREAGLRAAGSMADWLRSLGTTVVVERLAPANLARAAQLLNKTNQMNLRTRRMSEAEFADWAKREGRHVWTFRVSDKLGESGLTGIASLSIEGDVAVVEDYLLSCRVMGRQVEESVLAWLAAQASELGAKRLSANLLPTAKNLPCLELMRRSGFASSGEHEFELDLGVAYPFPDVVQLVDHAEALEASTR